MNKYSLALIAALNLTACFGQDTVKVNEVYCLPKAYADSIAFELARYDQLQEVYKAQTAELEHSYILLDLYHEENAELDSLNSANVEYYEREEVPRLKRKVLGLTLLVVVETILLLLK